MTFGKLAVGSWQLAAGKVEQLAVWQLAVGKLTKVG